MNPVELSWRGGTKITLMRRKNVNQSSTVVNFTRIKELAVPGIHTIEAYENRRRIPHTNWSMDRPCPSQKNLKLD